MEINKLIITIATGLLFLLYISSYELKYLSHPKTIIMSLFLLQIYSLIILWTRKENYSNENFHFEVSPEREKCLMEQVSLEQPPAVRSKDCCPVTHRGGNLKYVQEWKDKIWARPDSYVDTPRNNVYQTQLPPTDLFQKENKTK